MSFLQVIILAIIQGLCELLPVSSSAHVIVAAKLMGLKPASPEMTFLLVMLHTGTMFAVIVYFWKSWKQDYFATAEKFKSTFNQVGIATVVTIGVGGVLKVLIEKVVLHGSGDKAEVEQLFDNLPLIAAALAAVGVLIILAGRSRESTAESTTGPGLTSMQSALIGAIQGLCLPFRGFSRSGATISTGLLLGVTRMNAERFSFALAVVLTPPVIFREVKRLHDAQLASGVHIGFSGMAIPGALGLVCAFLAGLLALRWLSGWLEHGRWQWFGAYCLAAAGFVFWLALHP